MCGIAGIVARSGGLVKRDKLEAMTRGVAHRGPDDEGVLIDGIVGLGHRRLSILDLSAAGHQPMTLESRGLTIVFNGEIYNYIELRDELHPHWPKFVSGTDTEVILAAYAIWGEACVSRFNGMWAFAIHDRSRNVVFCSRDRFGVKPFYYTSTSDAWSFGSEIRQLLPLLPSISANEDVVVEFIFAATTEPLEETFFQGIRKLPGGHNLRYDLSTHRFALQRYYEIQHLKNAGALELEDAARVYGERFSSAVSLRLRSDVPVGTCLSGGLDSSSVATLAAGLYRGVGSESFRAITAVSEMAENDESEFARQVATHGGMEWIAIKPSYEDFLSSLNEVVRAQEEPFAGASVYMQYFVMRTARENDIPVLLDGQGGDETLLGYERYYTGHFLDLLRRKGLYVAIKSLIACWRNNAKMSPFRILQYLVYFSSARLRYWIYCYRHRYLRNRPAMPQSLRDNANAIWDSRALQKLEIETTNLPALLRYEDKNSMWHSIETRLPFLDYRAVELAHSLPSETKIFDGWTKYVMRCFMDDKMPQEITWRKNKFGFEAPDDLWLSKHADTMYKKVCASKLILKFSDARKLRRLYPRLDAGTRWRLYSVALWEVEFSVGLEDD